MERPAISNRIHEIIRYLDQHERYAEQEGGLAMEVTHGFKSHETQKRGIDALAAERDIEELSLPTGQCQMLKAS